MSTCNYFGWADFSWFFMANGLVGGYKEPTYIYPETEVFDFDDIYLLK